MAEPQRPVIPEAVTVSENDMLVLRQDGVLKRLRSSVLRAFMRGLPGDKGDRGDPGKPKRVLRVSGSSSTASGASKVTFSPAFSTAPEVLPVLFIIGTGAAARVAFAIPSNVTASGCDLTVWGTKAQLVALVSAIEVVGGVSAPVIAIGD